MNIKVLDANTLGSDLDLSALGRFGRVSIFDSTDEKELKNRIEDADILIVNKVKLLRNALSGAKNLRLICIAATGYDNIDTEACREFGIGVCNVAGYSTDSVVQITFATVLYLACNYGIYLPFVADGSYSRSGAANKVSPPFYELRDKIWGVVGYGNIGRQVAEAARAFGCRILVCREHKDNSDECVDIDTLCERSDIITLHVPLNDRTKGMINRERIAKMKKNAIVVNMSRGLVADEKALADALKNGSIGGLGIDVYGKEPMPEDHPFYALKDFPNVCFTPHMAWAAYEARKRCLDEIIKNIEDFLKGGRRNRVE